MDDGGSLQRYHRTGCLQWFDDSHIGSVVHFPDSDSHWKLLTQLSEKSANLIDDTCSTIWAIAVFEAKRVDGDSSSPQRSDVALHKKAIVKIHMQIPNPNLCYGMIALDPASRAAQATTKVSAYAHNEVATLRYLTQQECIYAPRLLDVCQQQQTDRQWVPGGCMFYILMTQVPGRTVDSILYRPLPPKLRSDPNMDQYDHYVRHERKHKDFVEPTQDEKDDIAEAFKLAYVYATSWHWKKNFS